jgi:predicted metal-dependent phosphoesterase TrpH
MTVTGFLKADLHVHSYHSGYAKQLPFFRSRECYSTPEEIYRRAKARGMDLVTITDHNTIAGCLELLERRPDAADFIIGEEIECRFPDAPSVVHVGALGMNERIHGEVQPLRGNINEAVEYLKENGVAVIINHLFHFFRGQIPLRSYVENLLPLFPAVEVLNGMMLRRQSELISRIVVAYEERSFPIGRVAGSDAHILGRIGKTYTEAPGHDRRDFLDNLRRGRAVGRSGNAATLAREIYGVVFNYWGSLLGLRRDELDRSQRLLGIGFSVLSIPFQIAPLVVAIKGKLGESARIARWEREWTSEVTAAEKSINVREWVSE